MNFTKERYEEIVLVLENESRFYRAYWNGKLTDSNNTHGKRRAIISRFLSTWREASGDGPGPLMSWPSWVGRNDIEDRDQIRRYFDDRYEIPSNEINKYADIPSVWEESEPKLTPELQEFVLKVVSNGGASKWLAATNKGGYTVSLAAYHGCTLRNTDMKPVLDALQIACEAAVEKPLDHYQHLRDALRAGQVVEFYKSDHCWVKVANQSPSRHFTYPPDRYRIVSATSPVHAPECPIPIPSPEYLAEWRASQPTQEPTMNKSIEITTKTFANGTDIATMKDADIYSLIAEQEAEIEGLKKIKAQPKKLIDEIAKREAGIAALVTYLDNAKS